MAKKFRLETSFHNALLKQIDTSKQDTEQIELTPNEKKVIAWVETQGEYIEAHDYNKITPIMRQHIKRAGESYGYAQEVVEADWHTLQKRYVEEEKRRRISDILEYLFYQLQKSDFFNTNNHSGEIVTPHPFDDRAMSYPEEDRDNHSVDGIIQWRDLEGNIITDENETPIRFVYDVTLTSSKETVNNKLKASIRRTIHDQMAKLKYPPREELECDKGVLLGLPRIIIPIDRDGFREICTAFLPTFEGGFDSKRKARAELKLNYYQIYFLLTIERQLTALIEINAPTRFYQQNKLKIVPILKQVRQVLEYKKSTLGPTVYQRALEKYESSPVVSLINADLPAAA